MKSFNPDGPQYPGLPATDLANIKSLGHRETLTGRPLQKKGEMTAPRPEHSQTVQIWYGTASFFFRREMDEKAVLI